MELDIEEMNDLEMMDDEGTGSHQGNGHYKVITFPFEKYEIKIRLTEDNEFVDILEIKLNRSFLSNKLRTMSKGYHDVEEFYNE